MDIFFVFRGWVLTQKSSGNTSNITRSINSYIKYWVSLTLAGTCSRLEVVFNTVGCFRYSLDEEA